jgi:hypothetical protein
MSAATPSSPSKSLFEELRLEPSEDEPPPEEDADPAYEAPPKFRHPGEAFREATLAASEAAVRSKAASFLASFHAHFPRLVETIYGPPSTSPADACGSLPIAIVSSMVVDFEHQYFGLKQCMLTALLGQKSNPAALLITTQLASNTAFDIESSRLLRDRTLSTIKPTPVEAVFRFLRVSDYALAFFEQAWTFNPSAHLENFYRALAALTLMAPGANPNKLDFSSVTALLMAFAPITEHQLQFDLNRAAHALAVAILPTVQLALYTRATKHPIR